MIPQQFRLARGGRLDRSRTLSFEFDGRSYVGHPGDTLASALLANGVRTVGRSFKYHRPRGVMTASVNEPNALVTLIDGPERIPNVAATTLLLTPGLKVESQNRWPSLKHDLLAVNNWLKPVFAAGFYYKTFMGPAKKSWMTYEPWIRRAAGLGKASGGADPAHYERINMHCDVLIVGAGPAGLSAAIAAGRMGARVILAEQAPALGGMLLDEPVGGAADSWTKGIADELASLENVEVLTGTTVFGAYDHGIFGLMRERADDDAGSGKAKMGRHQIIVLRAQRAVIATGALERGIPFGDNDKPGVMLASAARSYLNRFGVLAGKNICVFTNNDSAYQVALDLADAGGNVTVVDARNTLGDKARAGAQRLDVITGHVVAEVHGRRGVRRALAAPYDAATGRTEGAWRGIEADLVCVSGGWDPQVHLTSQRGLKPRWDDAIAAFVPGEGSTDQLCAGAVCGKMTTAECIRDGLTQGQSAAVAVGAKGEPGSIRVPAELAEEHAEQPILPIWDVPPPPGFRGGRKRFVDLQNDVATSDIALAQREGYVSVEHLKRYTTLGMGTDQGKIANVIGLANLAHLEGKTIQETGTTTFRPPYTPLPIGPLAEARTGLHSQLIRRTPLDASHLAEGAVMTDAGLWKRPWYYPLDGESANDAFRRETADVRATVGMVDVGTLGKIDVQGPDAAAFLERIYVNRIDTLKVGRARYGVMLREDGIVLDDGTVARLSDHHYFVTTTTAEAPHVMAHMEWLSQAVWPNLKVHLTSVSDQWGAIAVAGPHSATLLGEVVSGVDFGPQGLAPMGIAHGVIGDIPVRVHRISYSGERGYELYMGAGFAVAVWNLLSEAGGRHGLIRYGVEAMGSLRIEKGFVAGSEIDGRTTLLDLGLERMARKANPAIGVVMSQRPALTDPKRPRLVGLQPVDPSQSLRLGAILQPAGGPHEGHGLGHITSTAYSPQLGHDIALGFLIGGMENLNQEVDACSPVHGNTVAVRVVSPVFFDEKGERQNA